MSDKLMLTIDVGTQSVRTCLINKKGDIVGIAKKTYNPAYIVDHQGGAEQDADFYYNAICSATKDLKKEHATDFKNIIGVSLDTVRDTAVMLDDNYKPMHRVILWLDQRLAKGVKKRPWAHRALFSLIGMGPTIKLNIKKSISLWYQENKPELWNKMRHYGNISSYLTYKLTGEFKDSPASIIGHFPLDFKKRKYYTSQRDLKNIYGIPVEKLPSLVEQGEILGYITKECSVDSDIPVGIPLYATGSDKSCESLGVGALNPHIAAISYGTASTVEVTTHKYYESEPFLPAYPSCVKGYYNMDVQIYRGYWMINWFLKTFCRYNINNQKELSEALNKFNKEIIDIAPGCDGLLLQPYWQPGLARPSAKGAIIGFTDAHTAAHLYRAIVEGIAYALRDAMLHFEKKTHHHIKEIMISGGGSQSDEICQITANLFGLPVSRVQTFETSSLGAAIAGFIAAKEFNNATEAVRAMVHHKCTFTPNADVHKIYDKLFFKGYKKMYPSLKKIYKNI